MDYVAFCPKKHPAIGLIRRFSNMLYAVHFSKEKRLSA